MTQQLTLGIVQGRLTVAPPGELQWFPQAGWMEEFRLAKEAGYQYIELVAEREHNEQNPIWSDFGIEEINRLVGENGLVNYAVCDDYIVNHSLLSDKSALEQTYRLLGQGKRLGVKIFVYPLFEESGLSEGNQNQFVSILKDIADAAEEKGMILCLETLLNGRALVSLLEEISHKNIQCVFDTGNRAALNQDLSADIKLLGARIQHVHIKDKNDANENVRLGSGKVDFGQVFKSLGEIHYQGCFTFETVRGSNPFQTAKDNKDFLMNFYKKTAAYGR